MNKEIRIVRRELSSRIVYECNNSTCDSCKFLNKNDKCMAVEFLNIIKEVCENELL